MKAVVAYVPSGHLWAGIGTPDDNGKAAWTYRGKPLPFVPQSEAHKVKAQSTPSSLSDPIPLAPAFLDGMAAVDDLTPMTIPVEQTNGAILLISGDDDQMWPSTPFSELVMERLRQQHFSHAYEHLHYPDAGHLVLSPYLPTTVRASGHPIRHAFFAYGGTPQGGAFANANSWQKMLRFLDSHLRHAPEGIS